MTDDNLRKEMLKQFGPFGEVCWWLAFIRKDCCDGRTDNELAELFEARVKRFRQCFNKRSFIASCREPD